MQSQLTTTRIRPIHRSRNDHSGELTDFPLLASSVKLCGIDPAQTPNSCTQTSVTVPGEGTYTVNPDGTVTFNPLPTFVGQVATPGYLSGQGFS
jgi:CshA-type fibril repeat protein